MAKKQKKSEGEIKPMDALVALDGSIAEALAPHRETRAVKVLGFIGKQGDQPQMLTLSGLVLAGGLLRGERRVIEAGARMITAHLLATATKHVIKRRVDRHRPPKKGEKADAKPRLGRRDDKAWTSFPSGHTAGAVAVAQGFARAYPEHRTKASAGAAIISIAQVCKQAHYVSDVTAGIVIGVASEAIVNRFWPRSLT
jgi:membrane-associated phospholipid phosphatase